MDIDAGGWTGEGSFTTVLIDALRGVDAIAALRIEDAPSSRVDAGYALIANELFVTFRTQQRRQPVRHFGLIPGTRAVSAPTMSLEALAAVLADAEGIGEPDYADEGMLQYLRTERIVAPYQTTGVKVVELVRIYEAGAVGPGPKSPG